MGRHEIGLSASPRDGACLMNCPISPSAASEPLSPHEKAEIGTVAVRDALRHVPTELNEGDRVFRVREDIRIEVGFLCGPGPHPVPPTPAGRNRRRQPMKSTIRAGPRLRVTEFQGVMQFLEKRLRRFRIAWHRNVQVALAAETIGNITMINPPAEICARLFDPGEIMPERLLNPPDIPGGCAFCFIKQILILFEFSK